ncbi:MAG TPA: cobalamin-dependent protein, partial [Trebonia sp.]
MTSTALFDGHDAAINIMRRVMQAQGAEVVHLGHDRSVLEVVSAVIEEDASGVAVSSYQGGHLEFFEYLVQTLRQRGAGHIRVYGGGGGTIVPAEIDYLHSVGVARIFAPEDGQRLGLAAMVNVILRDCDQPRPPTAIEYAALMSGHTPTLARLITAIETATAQPDILQPARAAASGSHSVVLGIT